MTAIAKISLAAASVFVGAMAALAAPAMARDGADGKPLKCINLMSMGDTPVINERTILIEMKGGPSKYKRMDLAGPCNGIEYKGFAHQTGYNELCTSDTLTSLATPGAVCKIQDITDISDTEAKELLHKK